MRSVLRSLWMLLLVLMATAGVGMAPSSVVFAQDKGDPTPPSLQANQSLNGSPLRVVVRDGLAMEVYYNGETQFFANADGGTFLAVDGVVYGSRPAAGGSFAPIAFTPVSNGPVSGSGSPGDPFTVTTVVRAGNSGVTLSQTTTYVNGDLFYRVQLTATNTSGVAKEIRIIHAADLFTNFPGNVRDFGFGFYDPATGAIGALSENRQNIQVFIPLTAPTAYQEATYNVIWQRIGGMGGSVGPGFNNTINEAFHDAGAGLQWDRTLAAGTSTTVGLDGAFGLTQRILPPTETLPTKTAKIVVVQRPTPNHGAAPGTIVSYEIVVTNHGDGSAKSTSITMPFDPTEVRLLDAQFSDPQAWVSGVAANSLTIRTGSIGAKGGEVTGTLRFLVLPTATVGASLGERLAFGWADGVKGGSGESNLTILTVAAAADQRDTYTLATEPTSGPVGSSFNFSSGIFAPKEPVGVWWNLPDGSVEAGPTFYAEEDGSLAVIFDSGDLPAGAYSMVFYGHWTEFTAVGPFTIQ